MQKKYRQRGSPGPGMCQNERSQEIVDFWNAFSFTEDTGETTREVLEDYQRKVTDCLNEDPPNYSKAADLTFQAMWLLSSK